MTAPPVIANPAPPGSDTPCVCGPSDSAIPAGLPTLPRQRQTFSGTRAALLRAARLQPALAQWRAEEGELGLLLLEAWAYVSDVLGLYDRVIADESYLGTAQRPRALNRLLGLLGFRPRPGSGARAELSVTAAGPTAVTIPPSGFRSEAIGDEPPQIFESSKTHTVHPLANGWTLEPIRSRTVDPSTILLDAAAGVGVSEGGILVLRHGEGAALRLFAGRVVSVTPVLEATGQPLIKLDVAPSPGIPAGVDVADVDVLVPSSRAGVTQLSGGEVRTIALDAVYRSLRRGHAVVVEHTPTLDLQAAVLHAVEEGGVRAAMMVATGTGQPPQPPVEFVMSSNGIQNPGTGDGNTDPGPANHSSDPVLGAAALPTPVVPITRISLPPSDGSGPEDSDPSAYTIHYDLVRAGRLTREARSLVAAADLPADGAPLAGTNELPPPGLRQGDFFLCGADGVSVRAQGEVVPGDVPGLLRFKLTPGQAFSGSLRAPVRVRGNLVEVTRGETVPNELLGSGDASRPFLSFKLARENLTYLPDRQREGRLRSTLEVRVNGILWTEVESFFGQGPSDEVYIVRHGLEDRRAVVTFGDGIRGRRPPTGTQNIVARYRAGTGATQPPAGAISSVAGAIKNVLTVTNPRAAEGGSDPERPELLRTSAPREALLLGRLVSVQDFQARVEMEPNVLAARAEWAWDAMEQRALVRIVYIGSPDRENLESSLRLLSEPGTAFRLVEATAVPASLTIEIAVDPRIAGKDVEAAIEKTLLDGETGALAPRQIGIGSPLLSSTLFGPILGVPGVLSISNASLKVGACAENQLAAGVCPGDDAYLAFGSERLNLLLVSHVGVRP